MTELLQQAVNAEKEVSAFPIGEYWLDIGQHSQLSLAKEQYEKFF